MKLEIVFAGQYASKSFNVTEAEARHAIECFVEGRVFALQFTEPNFVTGGHLARTVRMNSAHIISMEVLDGEQPTW